jgi:glycerol kinase
VLEGVAFQVHDLADAMARESGRPIPRFKVDGGASASDLMMQFQADLLGAPVVRPRNLQTTALGAALLAGQGAGVWPGAGARARQAAADRTFRPRMGHDARERHLAKWRRAVERA